MNWWLPKDLVQEVEEYRWSHRKPSVTQSSTELLSVGLAVADQELHDYADEHGISLEEAARQLLQKALSQSEKSP